LKASRPIKLLLALLMAPCQKLFIEGFTPDKTASGVVGGTSPQATKIN
jgi:hypothetical protein